MHKQILCYFKMFYIIPAKEFIDRKCTAVIDCLLFVQTRFFINVIAYDLSLIHISLEDDENTEYFIADEIITPEIQEDIQFNYNNEKLSEESFYEMTCIVNGVLNENLIKAISHLNYLNRHITDGSNMENKIQIKLAVEEIEKIKQKISLIKQQLDVFKNFEK